MLKSSFPSITLIGAGNLATHLSFALHTNGFHLHSILSKSSSSAAHLANQFSCKLLTNFKEIPATNLVFVCVNDTAIQSVITQLAHVEYVVYTAGNISLDSIFSSSKIGVFYPLQTFSKTQKVNFENIPLLIESSHVNLRELLISIGQKISTKVELIDSKARKELHLAAVFVNNFTNHLCFQANQHLEKQDLDWNLLKPLLHETITKLNYQTPFAAQTGPARRGDLTTISDQLERLSGNTKLIYEIMTTSIQQTYSEVDDKL